MRRATIADIETLVALRKKLIQHDSEVSAEQLAQLDDELRAYFKRQLETETFVHWLIEEDGAVAAMGGIQFLDFPPSEEFTNNYRGYIMNVYTSPDFRGEGYAKDILDAAIAEAKARGVEQVLLVTTKMGQPVYEKYGFQQAEEFMEILL